jgi:protein-tyrosine-phosphatase
MAEAVLRRRLDDLGIEARVHSAGLIRGDEPASAPGVEVLAGRGLDISSHRSRIMNRQLLAAADLVVGMAREHVREAVLLVPDVWPRAFTLKELVRRGEAAGPRAPGESFESWLTRSHGDRSKSELLGHSDDDDVYDPLGEPKETYERTADEISGLVDRLVGLAWPAAARETA